MEVGRTLGRVVLNARLYERERHLVGELQELDRYKGELIATISHELKTPLTSIIGHIELLEDLDTGIGSVEAISRNAERLNRLVQNLLNYSQIQDKRETVRLPGRPVPARRAEPRPDDDAGRAGPGEDEPHGSRRAGAGDRRPRRARQGHRQPDQQRGQVQPARTAPSTSRSAPTAEHACVLCEDTGLGISAADQVHLFSAFHRSSNPEALSIPGTGLGLAISRRIAQMHGGEIIVASELGVGSTFRLRLPLRDASHGEDVVDSALGLEGPSDPVDLPGQPGPTDEVAVRRIGRAG